MNEGNLRTKHFHRAPSGWVLVGLFLGSSVVAQDWNAGETFADPLSSGELGPEMVVIPAGSFRMGCGSSYRGLDCSYFDESLDHDVRIPRPFGLANYEVTVADWEACVDAGGCDGYRPEDPAVHRGNVRERTHRRVGFRITRFEACSAFTRVAAHMLAEPPTAALAIEVLQTTSLPPSSAPTASGWSDSCRADSARAGKWRLITAHCNI